MVSIPGEGNQVFRVGAEKRNYNLVKGLDHVDYVRKLKIIGLQSLENI